MDKRFFLALFLSLIVIALSQLLFPPPKPNPSTQQPAKITDTSARVTPLTASSTATVQGSRAPSAATVAQPGTADRPSTAVTQAVAETTSVTTPKAIYNFSNIGAVPVSVVLRDYENRAGTGGPVTFVVPGNPLLGYRLLTPTDTVELSKLA